MPYDIKLIISLILTLFWSTTYVGAKEITISVLDNNKSPLNDVVVYLTTENNELVEYQSKEVKVLQRDKKFTPYISVKHVKDTLVFENQDTITHHIFTVLSRDFNFRLKKDERRSDKQITKPGQTLMACNIHDWMAGYILTVDSPYFGKTNSSGEIIFDVPDNLLFYATIWHPQFSSVDQMTKMPVSNGSLQFNLTQSMKPIPSQDNDEIFDFLEDY